MNASTPSWEGDTLRPQREVQDAFPDPVEYRALASGQLYEKGWFIREQLDEKRHATASEARLLWYLKEFAGTLEADEMFERYIYGDNGNIAVTALVGFGVHALTDEELMKVNVDELGALVRVANVAALLYAKQVTPLISTF